ncbi:MAG: YitT family protein [Selenomonadaceae bacterium]
MTEEIDYIHEKAEILHEAGEKVTRTIKGKKKSIKEYIQKYVLLFVGAMIAAAGLEIFLIPNNIIDGGVVGISIMGSYITELPLGIFLVALNLPFVYLGYKQIGKSFAIATIYSIICLSMWTAYFRPIAQITEDFFLAAIFGGIVTGLGVGIIIRNGGSLDGTEIVAIILDKKTSFSVGEVVMFFNLFILGSAGFLFGWDKSMYSLVAYFVISKMIDVVIKGLDESYAVMIITDAADDTASALMDRLGRGVTYLNGEGAYTGNPKKVIYCVVTRLEVDKLKEIAYEKDENAFVTINPVQEIIGGRFKKRSIH